MVEEKEKKERFELVEVPTEYGLGFKDNFENKVLDLNQVIIKMANEIEEIKRGLVG